MNARAIEDYGGKVVMVDGQIGHAFKDRQSGKYAFMRYGEHAPKVHLELVNTIRELEVVMRQFEGDLRGWSVGRSQMLRWPSGEPVALREYERVID